MTQRLGFEKLVMLMVLGVLALFALAVYATGAYYAANGTASYMQQVQNYHKTDALIFAGLLLAIGFLTSAAAVFTKGKLGRLAFGVITIATALLTVYTTLEGKQTLLIKAVSTDRQSSESRALITREIDRLTQQLADQSSALKAAQDAFTKAQEQLPKVTSCDKSSKFFNSCNAQRIKQTDANERLLNGLKPDNKLREDIDKTNKQLSESKQSLADYDTTTLSAKDEEAGRLGFSNLISSAIPEIAALLGSLFLNFFARQMALIFKTVHTVQTPEQLRAEISANHEASQKPDTKGWTTADYLRDITTRLYAAEIRPVQADIRKFYGVGTAKAADYLGNLCAMGILESGKDRLGRLIYTVKPRRPALSIIKGGTA